MPTMDSHLAIYPTARKVEQELRRMSDGKGRGEGCVMGHRIMTFPQLVEMLWRESGSSLRTIDAIGERLALDQFLTHGADAFARSASGSASGVRQDFLEASGAGASGGLAACIGGLIRQMKSA